MGKQDQPRPKSNKNTITLYRGIDSQGIFEVENEKDALAKRNGNAFLVKVYTSDNTLVHPFDPNANMKLRTPHESPYKWVRVSETVFNNYVDFLKTKHEFYLKRAERERLYV